VINWNSRNGLNKYVYCIAWTSIFICVCVSARAQSGKKPRDHDTTYYRSYRESLVARVYLSRKYTTLKLTPPGDNDVPIMKYRPNTTLNIGIGGTYRSLTLNIGIGINSFNPNNERGETHYLDLQAHFYARKWNFDFLGQFYTGYYLSPQGLGTPDGISYYVRPDLRVQVLGLAVYRALNDQRFSYQAGLVQNEWQKKSAGSILIGAETYFGTFHGDSTLVPAKLDSNYAVRGIQKVNFYLFGPGVGYGYTLVFKQHFFLLASATVNLALRYAREKEIGKNADNVDFTPNFIFHAGLGYNSEKWDLSVLWVSNRTYVKGPATDYKYTIDAGNYRLIYAKRFTLNKKVRKVLQPINNLIEPN
jgi:Domain of unknown function (DUF4421)